MKKIYYWINDVKNSKGYRTIGLALICLVFISAQTFASPIIYSTHGNGTRLGIIDAATAAATDIGSAGFSQTWAAAFDDGTGELFTLVNGFSGNPTLGTYNILTGRVTTIGSGISIGQNAIALEVANDGTIYGAGYSGGLDLFTIDRTTGLASTIGSHGISNLMDLAFDPISGTLWGTVSNRLYTIDTSTGASTFMTTMVGPSHVMGLMFGDDGTMYATDYTSIGNLFTVNSGTGATTLIGSTGFNRPHGGDILIPEPATLSLLALGGLLLRRRKSASKQKIKQECF